MKNLFRNSFMKFKKTFHKKNENIYLSKIKYDVLNFISNFIKENNFSPTFVEVGKKFKFSRARAGKIISELYELGFISKGESSHRKIRMDTEQLVSIEHLNFNREYSVKDLRR